MKNDLMIEMHAMLTKLVDKQCKYDSGYPMPPFPLPTEVEKLKLYILQNNCISDASCAICMSQGSVDAPWCLTVEHGQWVCWECAHKHDPVLAEVVQTAIVGQFSKQHEEEGQKRREEAASERLRNLIGAGYKFDSIVIDGIHFKMEQGQPVKVTDDDIPF